MSRMCITEYEKMVIVPGGYSVPIGQEPAVAIQNVAFTATAGVSVAFNARTNFVRIQLDGIGSILFSTAGTLAVAGAGTRLVAGQTEYYGVDPSVRGQLKVSAVTDT